MNKLAIAAILICCAAAVYASLLVDTVIDRMEEHGPFEALSTWRIATDTLAIKGPAMRIGPPKGMEYVAPTLRADSTGAVFKVLLTRGHVRLGPFEFVADGEERQIMGVFTALTVFPADSTMRLMFRSLVRPLEEL